ncbi:MAG: chemotaxis-specific protein-glutamate methyltransferase CheB [Candidatus Binatia bacterium]
MIRVLVAEDSVTARELLIEILQSDAEIQVVGEAKNGVEALKMTKRLRPSVVTMDIRMPLMDGFEATRRIMVEAPTPIVIVSASLDVREVEVSMHALRAGALTVLAKPVGPGSPEFVEQARSFLETVKAMSQVKVVRRWPERARREPSPSLPTRRDGARPSVVAIAASTGGPAALSCILSDLSGDFPLPILVVQHIARGFVDGLAAWLNTTSALPVKVAEDGEALRGRIVYIAPDDRHLGVSARSGIAVSTAPPLDGFRPSATFLFDSVARVFGSSAVAIILTGMGRDGVAGLRAVREAGGCVVAQDEESSVVFGMPGAAVASGVVQVTLPVGALARWLRESIAPRAPE